MKFFTATLTSLSLALGLAVPTTTQADNDDLAKIIGGIAAIAIIAEIADRKKERDRAKSTTTVTQRLAPTRQNQSWGSIEGDRRWNGQARGVKSLPLPQHCERIVQTRRGDRLVYGARCLDRRYKHANRLPQSCEVLVNTNRGQRLAYGARCLRRDGWRVANR